MLPSELQHTLLLILCSAILVKPEHWKTTTWLTTFVYWLQATRKLTITIIKTFHALLNNARKNTKIGMLLYTPLTSIQI